MRPDKKRISEFYKNYKQNLDLVMKLEQEQRTQGSDLIEWIKKYKNRAQKIYQLFVQNEEAIKEVLSPIFSGEVPMDRELAEIFLEEILEFRKGYYGDSLVSYEVLKYIVAFYEENPQEEPDNYIIALGLMGSYGEVLGTNDHLVQSVEYHTKTTEFKDQFVSLRNPEAQRRVYHSFYNRLVSEMKRSDYSIERIHQYMEEGLAFYSDERNRQVTAYDFDEYLDVIITRCTFATLTFAEGDGKCPENLMEKACATAMKEFDNYIRQGVAPKDVPIVCYMNYHLAAYRMGKISAKEAFEGLYRKYISIAVKPRDKKEPYKDREFFEVLSSYTPEMFCILKDVEYPKETKKEIQDRIVTEVMNFFALIPPGRRNDIANAFMLDAFKKVLPYYDITTNNLENIMRAAITRESTTAIHTNMVKAIASELVKAVIAERPELFIGTLDCKTVEEVVQSRGQLLEYANLAAFSHDIGKLAIADIINIQYRKITDTEFNMIKKHPEIGASILRSIPYLRPFADIARGHHKTYDDEQGYPPQFIRKDSENAIWIDIITLSDCIDAATDSIGRVYKKAKSFDEVIEELKDGAGTLYNPELVKLLVGNENLMRKIRYIITEGRDSYLFAVYRHMDK